MVAQAGADPEATRKMSWQEAPQLRDGGGEHWSSGGGPAQQPRLKSPVADDKMPFLSQAG